MKNVPNNSWNNIITVQKDSQKRVELRDYMTASITEWL